VSLRNLSAQGSLGRQPDRGRGELRRALADHDIEPPTGFLVLSIADTGTVELHLLFARA
jgi:hypothetical protein